MNTKKKKNYYKSHRKTVSFDEKTGHYYFEVCSDPDKTKFCYADFKIERFGTTDYVVGMNTYQLHKPGSRMVKYSWLLEFEKYITNPNTDAGRELKSLRGDIELYLDKAKEDFDKKWKARAAIFNKTLASQLVNNKLTKL